MKTLYTVVGPKLKALMLILSIVLLVSCSKDYRNAIPKGSTALLALDVEDLFKSGGAQDDCTAALCELLQTDELSNVGIDFGETLYGFETSDGTLGVVLSVDNESHVDDWIASLTKKGAATQVTEKKGVKFSVLNGSFLLGYSSSALVAVGPVMATEQADLQRRMARWLDADDEESIKDTKLYDKLMEMEGNVRLVGRSDALPEQLSAVLSLGTPKGTTAKDIYVALTLKTEAKGYTLLKGGSFSFDGGVNEALEKSKEAYKPIKGDLLDNVPANAAFFMACGVEGEDYLQMLRSNETTRGLLFGMNTALDIDKMLRSVKGDLLLQIIDIKETPVFSLLAEQTSQDWIKDVGYWKRSCPAGTTISDGSSPNVFRLQSKEWNVNFGIDSFRRLFVNNTSATDEEGLDAKQTGIGEDMHKVVVGKRLAMVADIDRLFASMPILGSSAPLMKALLGGNEKIVYTIE